MSAAPSVHTLENFLYVLEHAKHRVTGCGQTDEVARITTALQCNQQVMTIHTVSYKLTRTMEEFMMRSPQQTEVLQAEQNQNKRRK